MKYKYVMFDEGYPVLFPNGIMHDEIIVKTEHGRRIPTSAGFCFIDDIGNVETLGKSISLKMQPAENDARTIANMLKST